MSGKDQPAQDGKRIEESMAPSADGEVQDLLSIPGLEELPPQTQRAVRSMFSFAIRSGGPPPELLAKLTSEHITESIKQAGEEREREFADAHRCRWFILVNLIAGMAGVITFCVLMGPTNPALVKDVLVILAAAAGGIGGGYGIAMKAKSHED